MTDKSGPRASAGRPHPLSAWRYNVDQEDVRVEKTGLGTSTFIRYGSYVAVIWESPEHANCVVELRDQGTSAAAASWIERNADSGYRPFVAVTSAWGDNTEGGATRSKSAKRLDGATVETLQRDYLAAAATVTASRAKSVLNFVALFGGLIAFAMINAFVDSVLLSLLGSAAAGAVIGWASAAELMPRGKRRMLNVWLKSLSRVGLNPTPPACSADVAEAKPGGPAGDGPADTPPRVRR